MGKSTKETFCQLHALSGSPSGGCGSMGWGRGEEAQRASLLRSPPVPRGCRPPQPARASSLVPAEAPEFQRTLESSLCQGTHFVLRVDPPHTVKPSGVRRSPRVCTALFSNPTCAPRLRQQHLAKPTAGLVKCPGIPASCGHVPAAPQGRCHPLPTSRMQD